MRTLFSKITAVLFLMIFSLPLFAGNSAFYIDEKINNLFYSETNNNLYFSVDYLDYDKNGYYIWERKDDSKASLQRIFCPNSRKVRSVSDYFIAYIDTPNYGHFFNFLYSFADYGTSPVFATKDENGIWLYEEAALKYLCEYSKYNGWREGYEAFFSKYTDNGRFKLEELIFDNNHDLSEQVSAFTLNGHPEALTLSQCMNIKEGFFLENTQGIWYLEKQKDDSGILYKFCSPENKIEFSTPSALSEIKIKYSRDSIKTRNDSFIISTTENTYVVYNTATGKINKFENENKLNKYLLSFFIILAVILVILIYKFVAASKKRAANSPEKSDLISYTPKEINQKIFSIQESERKKISRDIHDTVIQDIRVLGIENDLIKLPEDDTENLEHKKKIQQIVTSSIIKLRNICYNLSPAELSGHAEDDSSKIQLVSMLNTLCSQFTIRTHIPCSVKVNDNFTYPSFEQEVTSNLFRVVQEALTNIEKHSYATTVSIFIKNKTKNDKNYLVIYISDDGVGCNTNELDFKNDSHRGLRNMKERMELIGGKIEFFSNPNEGLEITLTVEIK